MAKNEKDLMIEKILLSFDPRTREGIRDRNSIIHKYLYPLVEAQAELQMALGMVLMQSETVSNKMKALEAKHERLERNIEFLQRTIQGFIKESDRGG
jgi:hypothetical protein